MRLPVRPAATGGGNVGAVKLLADLRNGATWKRLVFLLVAFPLGIFYFTFLVTGLSVGIGLAITVTGIPLLIGMLFAWRGLARFERWLSAELLGTSLPEPYRSTEGQAFWERIRTRVKDPASWKDLLFLLLAFPVRTATFAIVVAVGGGALQALFAPAYYWAIPDGIELGLVEVDTLPEAIALVPLGAVLALLALHMTHWLAALHIGMAQLLLTTRPDPELEARVVDLQTSRARMVAAADAERRRLERDLHDGAQQRLVSLSLTLSLARQRAEAGEHGGLDQLVNQASEEASLALEELRDLARGLHPAILTNRGLAPALKDLAERSQVPVELLDAPSERLPAPLEATAYFVASEALTNMTKHAEASSGTLAARVEEDELVVEVTDDGTGGARASEGSGLSGLEDRLTALDGALEVHSPPGQGTRVRARMPLFGEPAPGEETAELEATAPDPLDLVALKRSRRRGVFRNHAAVFGVVLAMQTAIWAVTTAGYFWPVWTLIGWGALLALHAWFAFGNEPALSDRGPRPAPR